MLNSESPNLTCMALLNKKGINITDKNSIKAAASMSAAKANYVNSFRPYAGCILPSESLSTFSIDNANCQLANKYTLIGTKDGILSADQHVKNGEAIYPTKGCMYKLKSHTNLDPTTFMRDAGNVLDQQNQLILDSLKKQLSDLKNDCDKLDQEILQANQLLSETKNKLSTQQSVCQGYIRDINKKNADITDIKNELSKNSTTLIDRKANYKQSICIGQTMAEKCNKEIRHCYVAENCGYDENWTNITTLRLSNSRGELKKLQGYIPNILQKTISSLIIPPGIEVRIFDNADFIGGDTLYKAPLNSKGLDKMCLTNEKYNTNIAQKDYVGNVTKVAKPSDWNDKISSIRIRRNEKYEFIPGAIIESYINYNEAIDSPLINTQAPGNLDPYFYDPANPSITMSGDDYLVKYSKYDSKKVGRGQITKMMPNTVSQSGSDLNKYYTVNELSTDIPMQKCAKQCIDNGGECELFTFDPTNSSCTLIKSQGEPLIIMDATNSLTYVKKTPPVNLIDNRALPDGPYKNFCDIKTGTYDGIKLNINCPTQTNVSNNSSILTADCKPNTITNNNGQLECDSIYIGGLDFRLYEGNANDDIKYIKDKRVIASVSGIKNGKNLQTFTNSAENLPIDNFTIEWSGFFKAKDTGSYKFFMEADDLAYLWIGDSANANNSTVENALIKSYESWGLKTYSKTDGAIKLVKNNYYPFRIIFSGGGAPNTFSFAFTAPGMSTKTNNGDGYLFTLTPVTELKLKKECVFLTAEHKWFGGWHKHFFLRGYDNDEKVYIDDDKLNNASALEVRTNPDNICTFIVDDGNNNTMNVTNETYFRQDLSQIGWNDRIRRLTIKRK